MFLKGFGDVHKYTWFKLLENINLKIMAKETLIQIEDYQLY